MSLIYPKSLIWFRRDLRSFDHAALHAALRQSEQVFCVFIFDKTILQDLLHHDRRVRFIHDSIIELSKALKQLGGSLVVRHAHAETEIPRIAAERNVNAVFTNHDYEPQAIQRDVTIKERLSSFNCAFHTFKDQVIFENDEVLSQAEKPFSVFTPYKNAWLRKFHAEGSDFYAKPYPIEKYAQRFASHDDNAIPTLFDMGFDAQPITLSAGMSGGAKLLEDFLSRMGDYDVTRDFPAVKGPSYLSVHLRFGTVSIRHLVREAMAKIRTANDMKGAQVWLSELIWRDFYSMILYHHPHVVERSFKPDYDAIQWECGEHAESLFKAWCEGRTGYPLVDAAMLQLNQTGYMHNRLRMVTASFLVKDLGIDWRWGERYFAQQLNDFDLAANNGGWQWAASTGCDAQPYFRIFNPVTQSEKFDSEGKFIKRYLPQLHRLGTHHIHAPWLHAKDGLLDAEMLPNIGYIQPIVDHSTARQQTLERYAVVSRKKSA